MGLDSGSNRTPWSSTQVPAFPGLRRDLEVEICVIGAGIAGLTTAYLLRHEGFSVAVLEDGATASGQSGRTSAHLSSVIDDRFAEIVRVHGAEGARRAADSHTAAIDRIERIVVEERIDCDFERLDGYLLFTADRTGAALRAELEAASAAGLSVQRVERAPIRSWDTGPCLRFPRQAQIHPLKYLRALARATAARGAAIHDGTRAVAVHDGLPVCVETENGPVVRAQAVVVATNVPFVDRVAIHTKQAAYMTYVVAAGAPRNDLERALYWDDEAPYHYVRFQRAAPGEELLLVGGEDHRSGQAHDESERFARLEAWARRRFPGLGSIEFRWSGQVMEPVDGLAFIGRNPHEENVFVATGDSGMGMTHGTIAGILLTDLLAGRPSPWASLYDPSRRTLSTAREYAEENLRTVVRYADWLTPGDVQDARALQPGQGAVVRRGLKKLAVYRDESGELHTLSAICPHLGCIVQWNGSERTWDCPCHGSRFDATGRSIVGPANRDLKELRGGLQRSGGS